MIAVYITNHGFGHATRTAEVLRVLRLREPGIPITVVASVPERLFGQVPGGVQKRTRSVDFGLVQRDALNIAEEETVRRWIEFAAGWKASLAAEAKWLRTAGVRLVLGDIPPMAFTAAHAAGVPSVALGNFSWDWIYAHLALRQPVLAEAAQTCAAAQSHASVLLELPFAGDMSSFPIRKQIPLLARRSALGRDEARRRLGLSRSQTVVLVSFGGIGLDALKPAALANEPEFHFLVEAEGAVPGNVTALSDDVRATRDLQYEDVVTAADVVVTKPGYGIVSDAIGAGTRVLYTDRGDFPEYPILVAQMPQYLACRYIERDELLAGHLRPSLRGLLDQTPPDPPSLEGAAVAAQCLIDRYS